MSDIGEKRSLFCFDVYLLVQCGDRLLTTWCKKRKRKKKRLRCGLKVCVVEALLRCREPWCLICTISQVEGAENCCNSMGELPSLSGCQMQDMVIPAVV